MVEAVLILAVVAALAWANGANDVSKGIATLIVALGLATAALGSSASLDSPTVYATAIVSMVAGSLIGGWRVTRVLAEDVTPMDPREGLAANVVRAALVSTGAVYGLPMSTTHVSTGGLVGIGSARGSVQWRKVGEIGLAWLVTLPAAAVLAAAAFWIVRLAQD